MKRLILLSFILFFCCAANAEYHYYGSTASSNPSDVGYTNSTKYGSWIGDTYYNNNPAHPVSYTRQGNQIYGSDGSQYTKFGNTYQNNSTGQTYQVRNNIVEPL